MRSRRTRSFSPTNSFQLEDRVVLSDAAGLAAPVTAQVAAQRAGVVDSVLRTDVVDSELVTQMQALINEGFSIFASEYRDLRTTYFDAIEGEPVGSPAATAARQAFDQATIDLINEFGPTVRTIVNAPPGGAGVLDGFAQFRVAQLGRELIDLPPVGPSPLNAAEFSLLGEQAMADAAFAVNQFIQTFDAGVFTVADAISRGELQFFRGDDPGPPTSDLSPAAEDNIAEINAAFQDFATDFRDLRNAYFAEVGDGEDGGALAEFRQETANRVDVLRSRVLDRLDSVPGGAGMLRTFVVNQIDQFEGAITTTPGIVGTPLAPVGLATLTEDIMARSANDLRALVRLFDLGLSTTASDILQADHRVLRVLRANPSLGAGLPNVDVATAAQTAGGPVALASSGVGTARQFGFGGFGGFPSLTGGLGGFTGAFGGLGGLSSGLAGSFTQRRFGGGFGFDPGFSPIRDFVGPGGFTSGVGFGGVSANPRFTFPTTTVGTGVLDPFATPTFGFGGGSLGAGFGIGTPGVFGPNLTPGFGFGSIAF